MTKPRRGEVWLVDFDPPAGAEMAKTRPAVVMSVDGIGKLPLRIVVPISEWHARYAGYPWFVRLPASPANGLSKESGANAFQVKSISEQRFRKRLGTLGADETDDIAAAIALCVGMP